MPRFYHTPIWHLIVGARYQNLRFLIPIFICHFIATLLEGASFAFLFLSFSTISGASAKAPIPLFDPQFWGIHLASMQLFYLYISLSILSQAFRGVVNFIALYGTSLFALRVQTAIQERVYSQLFRFSFSFISQYKLGDLTEQVKAPTTFVPLLFETMNRFSVSVFMCLGLLGCLAWLSSLLTIFTLGLFATFAIFQKTLIRKLYRYSKQLSEHLVEFSHQILQSLQGIRPIHIFHKQKYTLGKIKGLLAQIAQSGKNTHFINNMIPILNETVNVLLIGIVIIFGSFLLSYSHEMILPNRLTYIALTYRLAVRTQVAMGALGSLGVISAPILRLNTILEDEGKEYDPEIGKEFKEWAEKIVFRHVSLRHPHTKKAAVDQISFSIQKDTTVAIVGLSGAGKSSILDLLLGLHKPTEGEIQIDGQPLNSFSHESWRRHIGVVSQDCFIFNGTIEENIRFGDESYSEANIKETARLAHAAEFIEKLPKGYQTIVGERGYILSGGERQRLALARALLRSPDILVLDEFTSNLDSYSEKLIQQSLSGLEKRKTIILVAHRLSTITNADQIIVLEQGRIVEQGTHASLLMKKGVYAHLWELQSTTEGSLLEIIS